MAQMLLMNPRRRKRKSPARRKATVKRRVVARRRPNPIKRRISTKAKSVSRRRRSYRRNPIKMGGVGAQFKDAFIGAGGAIGLDVAFGYIPLPAALSTGIAKHATKAVGAVLLGLAGNAFLPKNVSAKMANGALTVVLHDAMREQLTTMAPSLSLGDAAVPYYPNMPEPDSLGYYNPNPVVDGMSEYISEFGDGAMGEYIEF